jgi:hypothetical protein
VFGKVRQHRLQDRRVDRGGGVMIEVDFLVHGGLKSTRSPSKC